MKKNDVDLSWKRYLLPPIHPEGIKFTAFFAILTCFLGWLWLPFGVLGFLLTVFCFYFFRNPDRQTPEGKDLIIAPADGIVSNITKVIPSPEMDMGDEPLTRISIFMSVFNVHVNRAPSSGEIVNIHYHPGKFMSVADKDSEENEREEYTLKTPAGIKIGFVQIAGLVARRIVSFVKVGSVLKAGERFGLIRFGSRLDVFLPEGVVPTVRLGQIAVAGETILADMSVTPPTEVKSSRDVKKVVRNTARRKKTKKTKK